MATPGEGPLSTGALSADTLTLDNAAHLDNPSIDTSLASPSIETDSPAAATESHYHAVISETASHTSPPTSADVESPFLDDLGQEAPSSSHNPWTDDEDDSPPFDLLKYTESDDGFEEYNGNDGEERRLKDEAVLLAEAMNEWQKDVSVFDENYGMEDRPQDLAYTFQSLDNEMIEGFKPHQDPRLLAKYFGFAGADEFEKWNETERAVIIAMSPLLGYLLKRPPTEQSARLKFMAVKQCVMENQGMGKRNFTDRKEQHQKQQPWTEL